MTNEELAKVYEDNREEAISLAVRKWGYTRDHAEDAVQRAALYLLENWRKPTPPGRTAFIQNVRQQCVNLMGKNEGRSMSHGGVGVNKMVLVGDWHELADIERHTNEDRRTGRKRPKRASGNMQAGREWHGGNASGAA